MLFRSSGVSCEIYFLVPVPSESAILSQFLPSDFIDIRYTEIGGERLKGGDGRCVFDRQGRLLQWGEWIKDGLGILIVPTRIGWPKRFGIPGFLIDDVV